MDKHKLSEILQALPDSFSFTAVLEEVRAKKEGVSEQSQEQIQAQTLQDQIAEAYLESKEQELWDDIQESLERLLWADVVGFVPEDDKVCHYDKESKQWVDYNSYWGARIKEQLESSGIFMSEDEFASMLDFTHPALWWFHDLKSFYYYGLDDFIAYLKTTKKE